jgi:adenylate cyclase
MNDDVRPVTDESHQQVDHMGHLAHTESEAEATEIWRQILTGKVKGLTRTRKLVGWIPAGPRCKLCLAPMKAPGSVVLRPFGFGPSTYNRRLCRACFKQVDGYPGGAEVELSLLFADVRGSTGLAERMPAHEFSRLISRFYGAAGRVVENWNGLIDKFVGDEVVALFIPGFAGDDHATRAVGAAQELMRETGNDGGEPWVPIGAGVHTGVAFVGSIGEGQDCDFTPRPASPRRRAWEKCFSAAQRSGHPASTPRASSCGRWPCAVATSPSRRSSPAPSYSGPACSTASPARW